MQQEMRDFLVLNTPCMPKSVYHCGNAISSLVARLLFNASTVFSPKSRSVIVSEAWNLHGLPFENDFKRDNGRIGSYGEILDYAMSKVGHARIQKNIVDSPPRGSMFHCDADTEFLEYVQKCAATLYKDNRLFEVKGQFFVNILDFVNSPDYEAFLDAVNKNLLVMPDCHKKSILAQGKIFADIFPFSKSRVFSSRVQIGEKSVTINPIIESFIYPYWMTQSAAINIYSVKTLVSSSGHGMLKWHYLRLLLGWMVFGRLPVDEIVLHGSLYGLDFKPMSKHSTNCVEPSQLLEETKDSTLVRFILIRSISEKNIPLQKERSVCEYQRVKRKLALIGAGNYLVADKDGFESLWNNLEMHFKRRRVQRAIDEWYTWIRASEIEMTHVPVCDDRPRHLLNLFLGLPGLAWDCQGCGI